ncbi:MAG: hypothetical protein HYY84_16820 [Deltaproteobacteria bacterium]|nr:hypothetical protein [Deltaproteobacteria bacterium]
MKNRMASMVTLLACAAVASCSKSDGGGNGGSPNPTPPATPADAGPGPALDAGPTSAVDAGPTAGGCGASPAGLGNTCTATNAASCGNSCLTCLPVDGGASGRCKEACSPTTASTTWTCHGPDDACLPGVVNNQLSATAGGCDAWRGCGGNWPAELGRECDGECNAPCLVCVGVTEVGDGGAFVERNRCVERCNTASPACGSPSGHPSRCAGLNFSQANGTPVPAPRAGACVPEAPRGNVAAYGACRESGGTPTATTSCGATAGDCIEGLSQTAGGACAPTCKNAQCPAYPSDAGAPSCVGIVYSTRTCTAAANCNADEECTQGKCTRPSCMKTCQSNADCALGTTCATVGTNKICLGS